MGVKKRSNRKGGSGANKGGGSRPAPPNAQRASAASAKSDDVKPATESASDEPAAEAASAETPAAKSAAPAKKPAPKSAPKKAAPKKAASGAPKGVMMTAPPPDDLRTIGVYFEDEAFVTYESSRIPWWVRLMWLGFWLLVFFYTINYMVPDMQRWFGNAP